MQQQSNNEMMWNGEAEQSVLGAIMIRPQVMDDVADLITPEDFYRTDHGIIYRSILGLYERNEPVDIVTVTADLKEKKKLADVGGPAFLAGLSEQVGFSANAAYYAKIVRDKAKLRRFRESLWGAAYQAENVTVADVDDFIAQREAEIFDRVHRNMGGIDSFKTLVPSEVSRIESYWERDTHLLGVPSGFYDLDKLTCGFEPKTLTIIAGRPGMGKTALGLSVAISAAEHGYPVGFFSMEMGKEQLVQRALAHKAKIPFTSIRTGRLKQEDWERLHRAQENLAALPICIDDTGSLSPMELRVKARRMRTVNKVEMIMVDYLQLMHVPKAESRTQEIGKISGALKALSKELAIPVIALAQLNREVEKRKDKRPELSDLRESGSIEQDADIVIFIYRESVYSDKPEEANTAELLVKKQRNGPLGTIDLFFSDEHVYFANFHNQK